MADGAEDALALAEGLLRFCMSRREEYRLAANDPQSLSQVQARIRDRCDQALGPGSSTLTRGDRQALRDLVADDEGKRPEVVIARGVAEGLDTARGHTFAQRFRLNAPQRLLPGMAFPRKRPDFGRLEKLRRLSTHPDNLRDLPLDRLPNLRLAPPILEDVDVNLELGPEWSAVADLAQGSAATLHPNATDDEFEWDDDGATFFNVRPRVEAEQQHRVASMFDVACQEGVDLVVIPELSTTPAIVDAVGDEMADRRGGPSLVVAGSVHLDEAGVRRNQSILWLRGGRRPLRLALNKNIPFKLRSAKDEVLTEGITRDRRPRLTVAITPHNWSFATVICRDFLEREIREALVGLGLSVLAVPAMTPKADPFDSHLRSAVTDEQTVSIFANNPDFFSRYPDVPRVHAMFGHPAEGRLLTIVDEQCEGQSTSSTGICVMDFSTLKVRWIADR